MAAGAPPAARSPAAARRRVLRWRRSPFDLRNGLPPRLRLPGGHTDVAQPVRERARIGAEERHVACFAVAVAELVLVHVLAAQEVEDVVAFGDRMLDGMTEEHGAGRDARVIRIKACLHAEHAVAHAIAVADRAWLAVDLQAVKPQPAAAHERMHQAAVELHVRPAGEGMLAPCSLPALAMEECQPLDRLVKPRRIAP